MTTRDDGEQRARDAVRREMTDRGWSGSELARKAGIRDASTVRDFLNGERWPTTTTQGKIEKVLRWQTGTIEDIARGAEPPPLGGDVTDRQVAEQIPGLTREEREELLLAVDRANGSQQRALLEVWRAIRHAK